MSLGGPPNQALDNAVNTAVDRGIIAVVAAGNENKDASTSSPARAAKAFTVGAIDQRDNKAIFSNFGNLLSIWAPGVDVLSAGNTTPTSTRSMSGTSMATPHVAGVFALYLSGKATGILPAQIQSLVKNATNSTGGGLRIAQVPKA
ncbi:hypothetical protein FRC02_010202 [Tulasnella sp. 418]|nr:hypothetical protein FRC02_010202 [Tulasnella sp. 418]